MAEALRETDFGRFDGERVRRNAERFSVEAFQRRFAAEVRRARGLPEAPEPTPSLEAQPPAARA